MTGETRLPERGQAILTSERLPVDGQRVFIWLPSYLGGYWRETRFLNLRMPGPSFEGYYAAWPKWWMPMPDDPEARAGEASALWCETCRDTHGPSGPHVGEIISPDKAELLREIDRQHAEELDAVFAPALPEADRLRALEGLLEQGRLHDEGRCECQSRADCNDELLRLVKAVLRGAGSPEDDRNRKS